MRQTIFSSHFTENGAPAGGNTTSTGLEITWQNGPLGRGEERIEPNGCFVETVILAALDRLKYYQTAEAGRFICRQNALAIMKLEEALHWLKDRTDEREARQVEGLSVP